jgi:3-isopropylmalate/(R)-2-methylmalate dehydratase small subunit
MEGALMTATVLRGKAWVFQGILDVDWEILSYEVSRQLQQKGLPRTYEELGKYCMVNLDPDFPRKVQKGDFIVGSENVGYGHDHDQACMAIKGAGVGAVLCESSNGNFVRNSIDHGLPVVEIKGISTAVQQGDQLEVDLAGGTCRNSTSGMVLRFAPLPDFLLEILAAGGVYPMLEQKLKSGKLQVPSTRPL